MPVSFQDIPRDWKLPLFWLEVDPSRAGLPRNPKPVLLVGQKLTAGNATADVPVLIGSLEQAKAAFGEGSMLERMFSTYFKNNRANEVWGLPVVEPSGGTAASGNFTFGGTITGAGVVALYLAGQLVTCGVAADDEPADVATNLVAAINAVGTLPVTAAVDGSTDEKVNLTCRWKGTTGNDIDIRFNYRGVAGGEQFPAGLTVSIANSGKLVSGAGVPSFTAAISALGEDAYEYVGLPVTDSTSMLAWGTEYGFGDTGRWGWLRELYGSIWSAKRDTYSNLGTWGTTENYATVSVMAVEVNSPSPVWEWAAAYTARAARGLSNDPARPLQTLALAGILPAPRHQRFSRLELNTLNTKGIATQGTGADGVPIILREATRYQLNSYSQSDDAYELATTLATLAELFRRMKHSITSKYPRHKLANDGTRFGPGQAIVTPKDIKAEIVAQYRADEFDGLVEDVRSFKDALIVERDPDDPNRVNVLYPPDLVNGLRIFATLAQFRLQYDRGFDLATA